MTLIILRNTYLFTNTRGTSLCRIYKYDIIRCISVEQTKPIVFVSYSQKCTPDFHGEKYFYRENGCSFYILITYTIV